MVEHIKIDGYRFHITDMGTLPGVTSVLSGTAGKMKDKIIAKWVAKVGQKEADYIRDSSIRRGNAVHAAIEHMYLDNKDSEENLNNCLALLTMNNEVEKVLPLSKAFITWLNDSKVTPIEVEKAYYSMRGYAGSPDLIGKMDDKIVLFDWKTARKRKTKSQFKDYFLQLSAYWSMIEENEDYTIDRACILMGHTDEKGDHIRPFWIEKEEQDIKFNDFLDRLSNFQKDYTFFI